MEFTLIICTYKRANALVSLLHSVKLQTLYPNEILVIDGSPDFHTQEVLAKENFENIIYHKVGAADLGLTRQRNFGIAKASKNSEILCFLDDDTILDPKYFEALLMTYTAYPQALGVGGYITNEVSWQKTSSAAVAPVKSFFYDGYTRSESSRFALRKKWGLDADVPPGFSPSFSHGRSVSYLPPSGKVYPVEQLMGGVSSFRSSVFEFQQFSTYFEGYGLYEDADFSIRLAKKGPIYLNTNAQLEHHHDGSGRPNKYQYGKMVVRNGWYVWKVKNGTPSPSDVLKWHAITWLLIVVRGSNILMSSMRKEAATETVGRLVGWISLFYNKPKVQ